MDGKVDDVCRGVLCGHGKRGTQGPIMTFSGGGPAHTYFVDRIRWLERRANSEVTPEQWAGKGVRVRPLEPQERRRAGLTRWNGLGQLPVGVSAFPGQAPARIRPCR